MNDEAIEKIRSLLRLASDPRTPKHEAEAAALAAGKRMAALDERTRERIFTEPKRERREPRAPRKGARPIHLKDPFVLLQNVELGLRIAKIEPPKAFSNHIVFVPREFVISWERLTPEEIQAIGWNRNGRIIRLVVSEDYFPVATAHGWNQWT